MDRPQINHVRALSHASNALLILLILVSALMVLSQANPGIVLPGRDYGIFSYIGQQIVLGKIPYVDAWDHKPPAIFYTDALGLWTAHGLFWGIWAIEFICLVIAIWLSYLLIKKLWGVFPALCGIAVWLVGFNMTLQGGNTTEEFPLLLHFLALILFLRIVESPENHFDGFFIGLAFSISFLFRANNAMVETAIVLTLIFIWMFERNFRAMFWQLLWMGLGALLPLLATAAYFWHMGIFREMFDASITYNLIYSGTKFNGSSPLVAGVQNLGLVAWMGFIGYGVVLFQSFQHWQTKTKPSAILLFLLIGCPFGVAVTDPAQRNYGHYFLNWLPFLALLGGLTFYTIQSRIPKLKDLKVVEVYSLGLACSVAVISFVVSGLGAKNYTAFANLVSRSSIQRQSVISAYVESDTGPGDTVLFWGGFPAENLMAHRPSPTPYITYPLLIESNVSEQFSSRFLLDLMKNPPVLIVDFQQSKVLAIDPLLRAAQLSGNRQLPDLPANVSQVLAFIGANYHLETRFRNSAVYRLNGTSAP